jgi:hypothetical protein
MNNIFCLLGLAVILSAPVENFSAPVLTIQETVPEKTKKEILISTNSTYYNNPSQVIEGVFKQARIYDFTIDEKVKELKNRNIQFKNKTVQQAFDILSKLYNISFKVEEIGKEKFYSVEAR